MVVVVFRSRPRPDLDPDEIGRLGQRMFEIASAMPGYVSYKDFAAADGENVAIAEFDSLESLAAWRDHPEHKAAQERGRRAFFEEYSVQVCTTVRQSTFSRPAASHAHVAVAGGEHPLAR